SKSRCGDSPADAVPLQRRTSCRSLGRGTALSLSPRRFSRLHEGRWSLIMRPRLTVLVTCKNELHNIALCLESVRAIAGEVLVADSGSTDGTLEYLLSRGDCRVIEREYKAAGDFKNWAISHAAHEWVLILEADERVTPALAEEIRAALAEPPAADGFIIA